MSSSDFVQSPPWKKVISPPSHPDNYRGRNEDGISIYSITSESEPSWNDDSRPPTSESGLASPDLIEPISENIQAINDQLENSPGSSIQESPSTSSFNYYPPNQQALESGPNSELDRGMLEDVGGESVPKGSPPQILPSPISIQTKGVASKDCIWHDYSIRNLGNSNASKFSMTDYLLYENPSSPLAISPSASDRDSSKANSQNEFYYVDDYNQFDHLLSDIMSAHNESNEAVNLGGAASSVPRGGNNLPEERTDLSGLSAAERKEYFKNKNKANKHNNQVEREQYCERFLKTIFGGPDDIRFLDFKAKAEIQDHWLEKVRGQGLFAFLKNLDPSIPSEWEKFVKVVDNINGDTDDPTKFNMAKDNADAFREWNTFILGLCEQAATVKRKEKADEARSRAKSKSTANQNKRPASSSLPREGEENRRSAQRSGASKRFAVTAAGEVVMARNRHFNNPNHQAEAAEGENEMETDAPEDLEEIDPSSKTWAEVATLDSPTNAYAIYIHEAHETKKLPISKKTFEEWLMYFEVAADHVDDDDKVLNDSNYQPVLLARAEWVPNKGVTDQTSGYGVVVPRDAFSRKFVIQNTHLVGKPGSSTSGANGKLLKAWPVKSDDGKTDLVEPTLVLRLRYQPHVLDSMIKRIPIQTMLNKALIRSGITASNGFEDAYKGAEAWYVDPHPANRGDLVFKANKACVQAIVTNRNTEALPYGCEEGKLIAGLYATPVYCFKKKLTRDTNVTFGHNTVKARYLTHPELLQDIIRKHNASKDNAKKSNDGAGKNN